MFFALRQHEIKEEAKQRLLASLPVHMLDVVDAGANQDGIEWEEEGREFYLRGQWYDVAYIKDMNGRTLIYCMNDTKEEKLLNQLAGIAAQQSDQKQGSNHDQQNIPFYSADFILESKEELPFFPAPVKEYAEYNRNLISATADIQTPPPRL